MSDLTDEDIAKRFHYTYERLAPQYGYETRPESATAWTHVPEKNRELMIATVKSVRSAITADAAEAQLAVTRQVIEAARERRRVSTTPMPLEQYAVESTAANDALDAALAALPPDTPAREPSDKVIVHAPNGETYEVAREGANK